VQVFGEFGRLGNIMPPLVETGLAFTRLDLTASAFYGEGGVRLLAAPHSAVTPYVEGTAGVAHLRFSTTRFGSTTDAIVRAALNLVDTRDPLVGVGGGILMQGGPLQFDVGYRYKRILTNSTVSSLLGAGQELQSHQIRFGAGVRF
jgi:opacity protein-like surface antigen